MNEVKDEAHLRQLFRTPSAGDILLIENIDSAGIGREQLVEVKSNDSNNEEDDDDQEIVATKKKKQGVSLSGLLNTIDTARNDECIIIFTSNRPDTLDKALVRPGRIDKKILFAHATQAVAGRIFTRMYQGSCASSEELEKLAAQLTPRFQNRG